MTGLKRLYKTAFMAAIALVFAFGTHSAFAASYTWTGNVDDNWTTDGNWDVAGYPSAAADVATFNTLGASVIVDAPISIGTLNIASETITVIMGADLTVDDLNISSTLLLGHTTAGFKMTIDGTATFTSAGKIWRANSSGSGDVSLVFGSSALLSMSNINNQEIGFALPSANVTTTIESDDLIAGNASPTDIRFEGDIVVSCELDLDSRDIFLGKYADVSRGSTNNQNQNYIVSLNKYTGAPNTSTDGAGYPGFDPNDTDPPVAGWTQGPGRVCKNVYGLLETGNGGTLGGAGSNSVSPYFASFSGAFWELPIGIPKVTTIRIQLDRTGTIGTPSKGPWPWVGFRVVDFNHPRNEATRSYTRYWVLESDGIESNEEFYPVYDNPGATPPTGLWDDARYNSEGKIRAYVEIEFHPGDIQGSPQSLYAARYFDNYDVVGPTSGWQSDGRNDVSSSSSGRVFVPLGPIYGLGDITIAASDEILPVELTTFSARYMDGSVRLDWQTATEINNHGFYVERSLDGEIWKEVGFVPGAGNSNVPLEYSYNDLLDEGMTRMPSIAYRLRQEDRDGTVDYSSVVQAYTGTQPETVELYDAYPNPFNPSTTLSFSMQQASHVTLKVYNTYGQEVATILNSTLDAGFHTVEFRGSELPSGVYFAVMEAAGSVLQQKLVLNK